MRWNKNTGVRSDHIVILSSFVSASVYPDPLRNVSYYDAETNRRLKFLTNTFTLPPPTIVNICKQRWQVELVFQVDQAAFAHQGLLWHQRGHGEDAIWIAVSVYVLVAIVRKRLELEASRYQILQILSLTLFEKTRLSCVLQAIDPGDNFAENVNQPILFDF
jgi:hypothetical protein